MTKNFKTCVIGLALALAGALSFPLPARATNPAVPQSVDPNGVAPTVPFATTDFLGNARVCNMTGATVNFGSIACATGSGVVYAMYVSSGTAGNRAYIYDAAATLAVTQAGYDLATGKLSPEILSGGSSATGCTSNACEKWEPVRPVRFSTALNLIRIGGAYVTVLYRLDSDNIATPVSK